MWILFRLHLDSNLLLLRWLCSLAFIAVVAGVVWPIALLGMFVLRPDYAGILLSPIFLFALVLAVLVFAIPRVLLRLSRCSRCTKRLFVDLEKESVTFSGVAKHWHDHRAKAVLGSYATGAMLRTAKTGSLRCMWCGYQLGESRVGVVLGPDE